MGYTPHAPMPTTMPSWLESARRAVVIEKVHLDPRTRGDLLLGVRRDRVTLDVLGHGARTGQADFTQPWNHLSTDDVALLYSYFLQKGHLEELIEAFGQLFSQSSIQNPIVIDLGCGPCTGGLALAAVLDPSHAFTYVGVDPATAMHRLGESLVQAAIAHGWMTSSARIWLESMDGAVWHEPLSWRPVIVIVSYLLASPSLDAVDIINRTLALIGRMSWGSVTVVYTNAMDHAANRQFDAFSAALERHGFEVVIDSEGSITVERQGKLRERGLRYALFNRKRKTTFSPVGGA